MNGLRERLRSGLTVAAVLCALLAAWPAQARIVSGTVWEDENMNAIRVGENPALEPGLPGVTVEVFEDGDCDAATVDPLGPTISTLTAADGTYSLDTTGADVAPGGGCFQLVVVDDDGTLDTLFPGITTHFDTTSNQPFLFVATGGANDAPLPGVDIGYAGDTNQIVIIPHTTPHLVLDSNKGARLPTDPTQEGPEAFTVAAQVCNPGPFDLENINTFIGRNGGLPGVADNDPGEFDETPLNCDGSPTTDNGPPLDPSDIRLFLLDEFTNGDLSDASRFVGTLLSPGECVGAFFQLGYPTQDENGEPTFCAGGGNVADDLEFTWDLWATARRNDPATTPVAEEAPDSAKVRSMQSASQNKIDPGGSSGSHTEVNLNGDCDNDAGFSVFNGATALQVSVGQTFCIKYVNATWGQVNQGFDADNNGADDYDAWNQPVGERAVFDPDLVQLISVKSVYSGTCGGENISVTLIDNPYETRVDRFTPTGSCAPDVTTTYRFIVLSEPQAGDPTQIVTPYQQVASGDDNEKYNGDICPNLQADADPFTDLTQDQRAVCVPLDIQPPVIRMNKRNYISNSTDVNGDPATTFEQRVDFEDLDDPVVVTYETLYQNIGAVPVGDDLAGEQYKAIIEDDIPLFDEGFGRYVRGTAGEFCNAKLNYPTLETCQPGYSTDGGTTWTVFEDDVCASPAQTTTFGGVEVCNDVNKIRFVLKEQVQPGREADPACDPLIDPLGTDPARTDICDDTTLTDDDDPSVTVNGDGVGTLAFDVAYSDFDGAFGGDLTVPPLATNCPVDGSGERLFCGNVQNIAAIKIGQNGAILEQDDAIACIREDGACAAASTAVLNTGFGGYVSDGGDSVVWWETDAEVGTLGFYVERRNSATGVFERVNPELIMGTLFGAPGQNGHNASVYQLVDRGVFPGETHVYRLVEIEIDGDRNSYGPYEVTFAADGSKVNAVTAETVDGNFGRLVSDFARESRGVSEAQRARQEARKAERKAAKTEKQRGRRSARLRAAQTQLATGGDGPAYRVRVRDEGIHFVDTAGLGLGDDKIVLANRGNSVATLPSVQGFYFFGQGIDSVFTLDNVYQLSGGKSFNMGAVRGRGPKARQDPASSFDEQTHFESEVLPATAAAPSLGLDGDDDFWFWSVLVGAASRDLGIDVHDPDPTAQAVLTVNAHGASFTEADPEHRLALSLNGQALALQAGSQAAWRGSVAHSASFVVPAGLLQDGANEVTVTSLDDPGGLLSIVWVDSFDLSYARHYLAVDDEAIVRGNGDQVISVSGFTTPDVLVLDVSNPASPQHIEALSVDQGAQGYRVSFESSAAGRYALAARSAVNIIDDAELDEPSALKDAANDAEYVVIAADELIDGAASLVQYRGGYYSTQLVRLSDIFDEFNYGINNPHAIEEFLSYAYQSWSGPPRFAVFVGDGSFDYRDIWDTGDNLLPTLLTPTPQGLFSADALFGDVTGDDDVPEIAVSRLPAATSDELSHAVDKIIAYETGAGDWVGDVMLIADNADTGGAFSGNLSDIRGLISAPPYQVSQLSLENFLPDKVAQARQLVVDGFNEGKSWVNYIGHGGDTVWASEMLLDTTAAANLSNDDAPPVVTSLTCNIARFEIPGFVTLAETLVLEQGGAVAAWSPSGQSINDQAHILNLALTNAVFNEGAQTLGEAVNQALRAYSEQGNLDYMGRIYNLLGDAGLRLRRP